MSHDSVYSAKWNREHHERRLEIQKKNREKCKDTYKKWSETEEGKASRAAAYAAYQQGPRYRVIVSLTSARGRCRNPRNASFKNYGAKGILYLLDDCREEAIAKLLPGYEALIAAGKRPSINRINPKGHYSLDNIEAIEFSENCRH